MSLRFANLHGRANLLAGEYCVDVERASGGRFASDPMQVVQQWAAFVDWAGGIGAHDAHGLFTDADLGPPIPRPSKVFGIGLNYHSHAQEAGMQSPAAPMVFTKFPNCIVGPCAAVTLSSAYVDWEVELVVVIGRRGRGITAAQAFDHIAGYCIGQDISDRKAQFADTPPQFSMGKSFDTFGPIGPAVVSTDTFSDPNDLELSCDVAGERMQSARTSDMIFSVPQLVSFLSHRCTLEPGDLIFTGTPSGVGSTRTPRRYLRDGDDIISRIEAIGSIRNRCVGPAA